MIRACDYLVIGGGVAGCVVTRRLIDSGYDVILIEAGIDPLESDCVLNAPCADPLRAAELWESGGWMLSKTSESSTDRPRVDYAFETEPELGLGGRRISLNAGCCLGGGSAINAGLYGADWVGPTTHPWREWCESFGLAEWHPDRMGPCVQRVRRKMAPLMPPEHERLQAFDRAMALEQSRIASRSNNSSSDIAAIVGITTRIAWLIDQRGKRVTAATSYLGLESASSRQPSSKGSLRVLTEARALKLLIESREVENRIKPFCSGALVEYRGSCKALAPRCLTLHARHEVIVCCGPILTPLLLMRSGIGPAEQLSAAGISLVVDSPHVGKNLITQPTLPLKKASESSIPEVGPLLQPISPAKAPLGHGLEVALFAWPQMGILYALGLNTPMARGDITLAAGTPSGLCLRLGLLSHPSDVERMLWGLQHVRGLAANEELKKQFGGIEPELPCENCSRAELLDWLKARVSSTRHPLGTCRMGHSISDAVCDSRGRVFNCAMPEDFICGLRVADNSLAPSPPLDSHVMRLALAIGERIAELILEDNITFSRI